jgi:uncharacterized protein (TIGR02594 family)
MTSAYDIARRNAGLHERRDETALRDYLYNGGRSLSPATRAWCADFVNASLSKAGHAGTGSGLARSFLNYGQKVDKPEVGDIVVLTRGDPKSWTGHVGFYEGTDPDGRIRVLGGNQSNAVTSAAYAPDRVLGYRRPGAASDGSAPTATASAPSSTAPAPPPATVAAAGPPPAAPVSSAPQVAKAEAPSFLSSLSNYGSTALKLAGMMSNQNKQPVDDEPDPPMQFVHQPIRPANVQFDAGVPYMDKMQTAMRLARADGGMIPAMGMPDTGMNVPESSDSLRAQQRQLIEGRRPAQMFPRGTPELPLPPGMDRIETERGVFHFDPLQLTSNDILRASAMGRENEILGLGPMSKDDVVGVARETGESPVAITERDRSGNEIRSSLATPSTVETQSDTILRSAAPGHSVGVEPVEDVIEQRSGGIAPAMRASGGGIGTRGIAGPLYGSTGGRADKVPATARSGSHVIPADIVSHMGQGNTNAGLQALERMFKTGPYGTSLPARRGRRGFADGGEIGADEIPVMLSDGEFVVPPEVVAELGNGDTALGHDALDAWIMDERRRAIDAIASLPPPATD